ncbi:hypothetical protein ACIHIX_24205 [Streptomyces sp. NPDC051913]|uniref:hypothetical protein n=1 Tax=Streptomyces sp. NPDC051913 TaxID=3365676 RepID=UPI0037CD7DB1
MAMTLSALAGAATLAITVPGSAYAANGVLVINGAAYEDPSGCYAVDTLPSMLSNFTDAIAEVHSGPDCTGPVEWLVYPGETHHSDTAQSIFVL